jgi:hypothetical protein
MAKLNTAFSAAGPALGYLYQSRVALWLALSQPDEAVLRLEGLDDIDIAGAGPDVSLVQLKHHISKAGALTDSSVDLWKTIRVWAEQISAGAVRVDSTTFALLTTATAPNGSAASFLRKNSSRDSETAQTKLTDVATNSTSSTIQPAIAAFLRLDESTRALLFSRVYVVDETPNILNIQVEIQKLLRPAVKREFLGQLYERLEGWWFKEVVARLASPDGSSGIATLALYEKVTALAEGFHEGNLPIDFLEAEPGQSTFAVLESKVFVQQLREINVDPTRVKKAILDYYRAFEQRSRWARESLLIGDEVEAFERKLIDEWQRFFLASKDELSAAAGEDELKKIGRKIFNWADLEASHIRIRPRVVEDYVRRGSFHMLADSLPTPRVHWHPDFLDRLAAIIDSKEVVQ